uniref:GPN-loop GTPase n=1 Tax=Cacopsylla melanoneura TaxID=428564 RepID=A0A8D8YP96_9HEMI
MAEAEAGSTSLDGSGDHNSELKSKPICLIVLGMAGSGKTSFVKKFSSHLYNVKDTPYVINLDPACRDVPYLVNIDRYCQSQVCNRVDARFRSVSRSPGIGQFLHFQPDPVNVFSIG